MNATVSNFRKKINRQRIAALVPTTARVLDAGCGFRPWLSFFPQTVQYVGVDYSAEWSAPDGLASVDHPRFPDSIFDAPKIMRSLKLYTHRMPRRFNLVVRVGKD